MYRGYKIYTEAMDNFYGSRMFCKSKKICCKINWRYQKYKCWNE